MKAILGWLALSVVLAGAASAELCEKCRDNMYTMDVGQCVVCKEGQTGSGAFKLCRECSAKLGQCEHCRAAVRPAEAPKDGAGEKEKKTGDDGAK